MTDADRLRQAADKSEADAAVFVREGRPRDALSALLAASLLRAVAVQGRFQPGVGGHMQDNYAFIAALDLADVILGSEK